MKSNNKINKKSKEDMKNNNDIKSDSKEDKKSNNEKSKSKEGMKSNNDMKSKLKEGKSEKDKKGRDKTKSKSKDNKVTKNVKNIDTKSKTKEDKKSSDHTKKNISDTNDKSDTKNETNGTSEEVESNKYGKEKLVWACVTDVFEIENLDTNHFMGAWDKGNELSRKALKDITDTKEKSQILANTALKGGETYYEIKRLAKVAKVKMQESSGEDVKNKTKIYTELKSDLKKVKTMFEETLESHQVIDNLILEKVDEYNNDIEKFNLSVAKFKKREIYKIANIEKNNRKEAASILCEARKNKEAKVLDMNMALMNAKETQALLIKSEDELAVAKNYYDKKVKEANDAEKRSEEYSKFKIKL